MLTYSILLEEDDGTLLATSPDFPELTTFGMDRDEALARAVDALEEAIAARIHDGRDTSCHLLKDRKSPCCRPSPPSR